MVTRKSIYAIGLVIFVASVLSGCGEKQEQYPEEIEEYDMTNLGVGVVEGSEYTNDYFPLSVSLPDEWYIADEEAKGLLLREARRARGGLFAKRAEQAVASTAYLLWLFEQNPEAFGGFVPSLLITAQDPFAVSPVSAIDSIGYLYHIKSDLEATGVEHTFKNPLTEERVIGGSKFAVMQTQYPWDDKTTIFKDFYVIEKKGYMLTVAATYDTDEEKKIIDSLIDSIRFTLE